MVYNPSGCQSSLEEYMLEQIYLRAAYYRVDGQKNSIPIIFNFRGGGHEIVWTNIHAFG